MNIDWNIIYNLFKNLQYYKLYKISEGFINEDKSIKTVEQLRSENNYKLLIKKLNNSNIYIHRINLFFDKKFILKQKKMFLIEKNNDKLKFYLWKFDKTTYGLIGLLMLINKKYNINNFPLTVINIKFKPVKYNLYNPITGDEIKQYKLLSTCEYKKSNNIAFLSYYIWMPALCFKGPNKTFLNLLRGGPKEVINYFNNISENEPNIPKLVFRGREMNEYRRKLYDLYSDNNDLFDIKDCTKKHNDYFIPFLEQRKYKYILDMHGLSGHSGRRFWMFHFNRVLFLPIDDPLKLFWEVSDNPPEPWVHFVPYSLNNLEELEKLVIKLENEPELYDKIKRNGYEYSKRYLNYDSIVNLIIKLLN